MHLMKNVRKVAAGKGLTAGFPRQIVRRESPAKHALERVQLNTEAETCQIRITERLIEIDRERERNTHTHTHSHTHTLTHTTAQHTSGKAMS